MSAYGIAFVLYRYTVGLILTALRHLWWAVRGFSDPSMKGRRFMFLRRLTLVLAVGMLLFAPGLLRIAAVRIGWVVALGLALGAMVAAWVGRRLRRWFRPAPPGQWDQTERSAVAEMAMTDLIWVFGQMVPADTFVAHVNQLPRASSKMWIRRSVDGLLASSMGAGHTVAATWMLEVSEGFQGTKGKRRSSNVVRFRRTG